MQPTAACTIVSNNYLAFATVLANSYRRHHPGAEVFVCVVDEPDPSILYSELPFTTVLARELGIPGFGNFAFRYDVLELNTAVKPYFLTHLRDHYEVGRAFYLDPDIWVMDRLSDLESGLSDHPVLLTPHITKPLDNEYLPSERSIRMAGIYNLGFLGLRLDDSTADLLEWWKERLYRFCVSDIHHGLFVDQSWMDFAPALIDDVGIVRDPRFNIAYWNLAQREVSKVADQWFVDGRPVGFYHLSGIDLGDIDTVSKHQNRLTISDHPQVRVLAEEYRQLVRDAGHDLFERVSYGYRCFKGANVAVPAIARRLMQRVDPYGRRWPDPFDLRGDDTFFGWLVEPMEFEQGWLNRVALSLWEERPDLVREFPDVCGADLPGFVGWLKQWGGGADAGFPTQMLEAVRIRSSEEPEIAASRSSFTFQHYPYDACVVQQASELLQRIDLKRPGALMRWLNEPIPGAAHEKPPLTRLAMSIYFERPDLQAIYPDCLDRDQRDFAYWFCHHAVAEYGLHDELVADVARGILDSFNLSRPDDEEASWLSHGPEEIVEDRPRITRLAVLLYRAYPEIRDLFPNAFESERVAFAEWVLREGVYELNVHGSIARAIWNPPRGSGVRLRNWARMLWRRSPFYSPRRPGSIVEDAGVSEASGSVVSGGRRPEGSEVQVAPSSSLPVDVQGVNLLGSLDSPTGVGQVAKGSRDALRAAGYDVASVSVDQDVLGKSIRGRMQHPEGVPYPVTILHANADQTPRTTGMLPTAVAAGYTVGYWFWELGYFPSKFAASFAHLDEVWAPTHFCQRSFEPLATVPVRYVPPCVPPPVALDSIQAKEALGLDLFRFHFLFCFDVLSVPERKNPLAAIEAMRRLTRGTSHPVGLVLKLSRANSAPTELLKEIHERAQGLPVRLVTSETSRFEVEQYLNACDAYLSLHRSEGLGLLPIESLYLEKPIVVTNYGGVTDFLDDSTGFCVPYSLRRLGSDYEPYPKEAVWADPDIDAAVEAMTRVIEDPKAARERARRGRQRVEELYSVEAAARRLRGELERITGRQAPSSISSAV